MKQILAITLLLSLTFCFSQEPIKVEERRESYESGMKNSLVSNIPLGDEKIIEKIIKDGIKKWKGKFTSKKEFFLEQATKTGITEKPIDVYIKVLKVAGGKIEVAYAFDLGGAYLNKTEHPDMYRSAETKIYELTKEIATEAVDEEVKEEEKKLKDLEKELDDLKKDKEKLEKSIVQNQDKIKESNDKILENKGMQVATKAKIDELHKVEPVDADRLKELNKEQEKNFKEREKLDKTIVKCEETITKAKADIETNVKSQGSKETEIKDQKNYIANEVKSKYAKIK